MKTTRRQQRIEQIAGVIRENLFEQAHLLVLDGKTPEQEARRINSETGWSYDVRWADREYPDDNAHTRVESERLSETDLETAIKSATQEPPRLYGINEIAEALGERRQTVALWHHRGKLPPPTQELSMGPVWVAGDIEEWISERRRRAMEMTAGQAWEGFVGSQTPAEFIQISREQGHTTTEAAVVAYVQDVLNGHISQDVTYKPESAATDEDRQEIERHGVNSGIVLVPDNLADLLADYIRQNLGE